MPEDGPGRVIRQDKNTTGEHNPGLHHTAVARA